MGDLYRLLNANGREVQDSPIKSSQLSDMVKLISEGTISGKIAKALIEEMFVSGKDPAVIVEEKGWKTIKDAGAVIAIVDKVFADNPKIVADIVEKGLVQKRGFLVGQVMKASQGKADPAEVNRLIDERLGVS